jgi:hypothetical protein
VLVPKTLSKLVIWFALAESPQIIATPNYRDHCKLDLTTRRSTLMTTTTTPEKVETQTAIAVEDDLDIIDSRSVPFGSWSPLDDNPDALRIYFDLASPDVTAYTPPWLRIPQQSK